MTFWVYIVHCRGDIFYTGHIDNLDARIAAHAAGLSEYTRNCRPLELVWSQEFPSRIEALTMERRIEGWGRPKKPALIRQDWTALSQLAAGKSGPSTSSGRTE